MDITLRPAELSDRTMVSDILIAGRSTFMPYAPSAHTEAEIRDWVGEQLIPGGGVTVAQRSGNIVALVATSQIGEHCWIEQMYVHPAAVGLGIGSVMLEHVVQQTSLPIRLYTFQANAGARRFYERHGFHALQFTDGQTNEERCPDVLYERRAQRPIG
ncbi:MAG: GNAT family N-acetyltransferase [Rhodocyclaceae bacterium]|nr:GNAT family N-acetyltransferase [Rhodocyclaceae bacterium]